MNDRQLVYREGPFPGPMGLYLFGLLACLALFVAGIFWSVILFLVGMMGTVAFVLMLSIHRYQTICVTRDAITVGPQTVPVADFDPAYGVRRGANALTDAQRADLEKVWVFSPDREGITIFGGAWARPTGFEWLVVRNRGRDRLYVIATRHADRLKRALDPLLPGVPGGTSA